MSSVNKAAAGGRANWIDWLRGMSVLMVVLLHAHQFAFLAYPEVGAGLPTTQGAFARLVHALNVAVAPLRMELMFLLSGMFVASGLRKGLRTYLRGKAERLLYPFILWSVLIFVLREAGSVLAKGEPIAWRGMMDIALGNTALTWFLYDLTLYFVAAPLLERLSPLLVGACALVISQLLLEVPGRSSDFFYYFIFFHVGSRYTDFLGALASHAGRAWLLVSSLACCALVGCAFRFHYSSTWHGYLPLVLLSMPLLFRLATQACLHRKSSDLICFVGRNSIVFYLVHFPLYVVLGYLLRRLGQDGDLMFLMLLMIGVCVPWTIAWLRQRPQMAWLEVLFTAQAWPTLRRPRQVSA
ncbi:acyltransferase family protein [Pseudoxanthomonas composti]|uniref:Acyltransferase n=1 Tax=Pseudoxanthomonas composti TaxID=2137479 RepID=A0A4Q1JUZ0_9GAMM|nr:acyltransferase [Pseudoxanthomonas composti]RXR05949.1 acyltransferase [Pseudoxanthomonas composti]